MKTTKKEIAALYAAGKLNSLLANIISNNSKADIINALKLIFDKERDEYSAFFESVPYSRGGKYARHTSTLHSNQSWFLTKGVSTGNYFIDTKSTSNSANCPAVIIPKFYTEVGRIFHNSQIELEIERLKNELL